MVIFVILSAALRNLSAKDTPSIGVIRQKQAFAECQPKGSGERAYRSYPHFNRYFYLETDASLKGIGFRL